MMRILFLWKVIVNKQGSYWYNFNPSTLSPKKHKPLDHDKWTLTLKRIKAPHSHTLSRSFVHSFRGHDVTNFAVYARSSTFQAKIDIDIGGMASVYIVVICFCTFYKDDG